jgi:hypothetical protein
LDDGPELFSVLAVFGGLDDAGDAQEGVEGQRGLDTKIAGEGGEFAGVGASEREVDLDAFGPPVLAEVEGEAEGEATAGDAVVDGVADSGFEGLDFARQVEVQFDLFAVDRGDFDGDSVTLTRGIAAAVACH